MNKCLKCGRDLTPDEIALHKKIVNRGAKTHMCIDCCAEYFGVTVQLLEEKIVQFKTQGCALFEENTP
ncbi:MAG: hypothetical protein UH854_04680 [Clostridia bacterium]|nr:hypothetical protein [Clostridia bacterium]